MKKIVLYLLAIALLTVVCRPLSSGEEKQQDGSEDNAAASFETMTVAKQDITLEQSYPA